MTDLGMAAMSSHAQDVLAIVLSSASILLAIGAIALSVKTMRRQRASLAARLAAESPAKREMRARHEAIVRANKRRPWKRRP